ncbi:TraH_2 protein [Agrobacterium fabrum]|uniref:TraH_2 protein n=1 Tax=Agrobacterium fabrum TaxID=1176649 RepID=A0A7Z7FRX9_9HYPH|nr:TraH family protein [Agrobacterium fabrum]SDK31486.1 TraH_2 protein [Agrobacterium fabrum]
MFDPTLIAKCADPDLKPAIVEKFIAEAGSPNPLMVAVKSGDRLILVPLPKTSEEAMAIVSKYVGNAVVRVGVTQYPAGIGVKDASELKPEIMDACENIRVGTALFAKVYRIVVKWYGSSPPEALDDAVFAWKTGYFEGKSVFLEPDPGKLDPGASARQTVDGADGPEVQATTKRTEASDQTDPSRADPRIDLSRINGTRSAYAE